MLNIRVISKIYDNHSLSIVSRKLCLEMIKNGVNLTIIPLDRYNPHFKVSKDELKIIKPFINKELKQCDIEIRHSYPPILSWPSDKNTKIVFIQPWEFNRMPFEWKDTFQNFADAVFVPSTWVSNIYINAGINPEKVKVVPNGYDPNIYNTKEVAISDNKFFDANKFIVTYVGNGQYRKGVDILIQAWHKSFVRADNAILFIKDTPQVYGQSNILENIIQLQYKSDCAKVIYNDDSLTEEEMSMIYKHSDLIVHPHRGEGFGMHIQEAMACGAFPIVPCMGATEDFVNDTCGMRLNVRQTFIDANDQRFFVGKSGDSYSNMGMNFWVPEVDADELAQRMRMIYYHHDRKAILDKVSNASLWTWDVVAKQFIIELEKIKLKPITRC